MITCGAQLGPVWGNPEKGLSKAGRFTRSAVNRGAELVCFPEQFATGWDPCSTEHAEEVGGPVSRGYSAIAHEHGVWIIGSIRERISGTFRNTCLVYRPDGTLETKYAKVHPFSPAGEHRSYTPGDDLALFRVRDLVIGLAICYDLRFPDLFTLYRDAGADAVIVPSAWPAARIGHFTLFIRARACEQQMYVFGINTTGKTPVDLYNGGSLCAGPDGGVVAGAGQGEDLVCTDLLPDCVQAARKAFFIRNDRRDDCYARIRREG